MTDETVAVLEAAPAQGLARLAAAGESWRVHYRSTSVRGGPITLTGLVHLPAATPPASGWPLVSYGHMTTGGGPTAAPSTAAAGHPEVRRMTQGDGFVSRLLVEGVAVVQPDYEGLGGDEADHPYLVGPALATSVLDLVTAARGWEPRLGTDWVSAGHSEGATAAAWAITRERPLSAGVDLRGLALFAPVTRLDLTIAAALRLGAAVPGLGVLPPLIGLMILGAATTDPAVAALAHGGGLSGRAESVWSHLRERPLTRAAERDSWGGIPPSQILGPLGGDLRRAVLSTLAANDVSRADLRDVPMRVDAAMFDEVAPLPLTRRLVRGWRRSGRDVTLRQWPTWHSGVLNHAPAAAAEWVLTQLRG